VVFAGLAVGLPLGDVLLGSDVAGGLVGALLACLLAYRLSRRVCLHTSLEPTTSVVVQNLYASFTLEGDEHITTKQIVSRWTYA